MKVYLDVCCLGRVFEESGQPRMQAERNAVEIILQRGLEIVSSEAVVDEIARDPNEERRDARQILEEDVRGQFVRLTPGIRVRAQHLAALGFAGVDALHLACAEAAYATWFLTTDDRPIKRARKLRAALKVEVDNPAARVLRFPQQ